MRILNISVSFPPPFLESHYCRFHMSEGHVVIVFQWELFLAPLLPSSTLDDLCWNCQNSQEFLPVFRFLVPSERNGQLLSMSIWTGRTSLFHQIFPPPSFKKMVSEDEQGNWSSSYLRSDSKGTKIGKPSLNVVLSPDTGSKRNVRNTSVQQRKNRVERRKKRRRIIQLDRLVFLTRSLEKNNFTSETWQMQTDFLISWNMHALEHMKRGWGRERPGIRDRKAVRFLVSMSFLFSWSDENSKPYN